MRKLFISRSVRMMIACLMLFVFLLPASAFAANQGNYITNANNTSFAKGDYLLSQNGLYKAIWQDDGNFVIYRTYNGKSMWSSSTNGKGANQFIFQSDGNLVIYSNTKVVYQNVYEYAYRFDPFTGTYAWGWGYTLKPVVVTTTTPVAIWASNTGGTGAGNTLVMQDDGNLVIYNATGKALWSSGTNQ
ncbi:hypothetical protein [Paenibacillus kobensis]|uniref:hypothetical protein n=1 Tax=Paenibacillus kobensis TaxID=59841 RepID=UPI001FE582CD|nr:hypothetical protein [Paenibacillus kobensis]